MVLELTNEELDALSSIATLMSVFVAVHFGRRGLAVWRAQIVGTVDHELARRALVLLYRYKSKMEVLRSSTTTSYEYGLRQGERPGPDFEVERFNQLCRGFDHRWQRLCEVRSELDVAFLECRAVWGDPIDRLFDAVHLLESEWYMAMVLFIRANSPNVSREERKKWSEILLEKGDVVYEKAENDPFKLKFNKEVLLVEEYLKSKLVRDSSLSN